MNGVNSDLFRSSSLKNGTRSFQTLCKCLLPAVCSYKEYCAKMKYYNLSTGKNDGQSTKWYSIDLIPIECADGTRRFFPFNRFGGFNFDSDKHYMQLLNPEKRITRLDDRLSYVYYICTKINTIDPYALCLQSRLNTPPNPPEFTRRDDTFCSRNSDAQRFRMSNRMLCGGDGRPGGSKLSEKNVQIPPSAYIVFTNRAAGARNRVLWIRLRSIT